MDDTCMKCVWCKPDGAEATEGECVITKQPVKLEDQACGEFRPAGEEENP